MIMIIYCKDKSDVIDNYKKLMKQIFDLNLENSDDKFCKIHEKESSIFWKEGEFECCAFICHIDKDIYKLIKFSGRNITQRNNSTIVTGLTGKYGYDVFFVKIQDDDVITLHSIHSFSNIFDNTNDDFNNISGDLSILFDGFYDDLSIEQLQALTEEDYKEVTSIYNKEIKSVFSVKFPDDYYMYAILFNDDSITFFRKINDVSLFIDCEVERDLERERIILSNNYMYAIQFNDNSIIYNFDARCIKNKKEIAYIKTRLFDYYFTHQNILHLIELIKNA